MREKIIQTIEENRIIAILRGYGQEALFHIAEALLQGGVRCMEITYDAKGKISDEQIAEQIGQLHQRFGTEMAVGAGTVLTKEQVRLTREAGGEYIISPNTDPEIIAETVAQGLVSIPGAMTPTECVTAWNAGADFVKLFPTSSLGAGYVKAITAPLSHIKFLAVGGVSPENIAEFVNAGVIGIGVGSDLFPKAAIGRGEYSEVTCRAKKFMAALDRAFEEN